MSDDHNAPESSDDALKALDMDLDMLEVDSVYCDDDEDPESTVYVEFTDGEISVTLTEDEMRDLPDAFFGAYVAWQEAGASCAEEARSERRQLYGGAY